MKTLVCGSLAFAALAFATPTFAVTTVIGFDNIPEGTIATNQYSGVTFTGASVLTQDSMLNSSYPPVSTPNVVYNYADGQIILDFSTNIDAVGAYVTGNTSITESIYDGSTLLGEVSTGGANYTGAGTGLSPNIFLSLASGSNITSAVFDDGNGSGNAFTLDNVTVDGGQIVVSGAPEPGTWALMFGGLAMIGGMLRIAYARRRENEVAGIATA